MIYPPTQKPPIWSIDPGIIAYNCQKHGMPHPILAMPMWEGAGNRALDLSGHGKHGALIGTTGWVADGLNFDGGGNSHVDIGTSFTIPATGTLSALIRRVGVGEGIEIFISRHGDGGANRFRFDGNAGNFRVSFGGDVESRDTGEDFITGVRHNCVMTWSGTTAIVYFDGINVDTFDSTNPFPLTGDYIRIGDYYAGGHNFLGTISNVHIFKAALSAAQVKFLYDNPYFMYRPPEELYGYVVAGPPPETSIPALMNYYRQLRAA